MALLFVLDGILEVVEVRFEAVARVDPLLDLLVLLGELLGLADHALDVLLAEAALLGSNGDLLGLAGSLVLGRHLKDTVGIDLEGDVDLGDTTGSGGDTSELELAQKVVVLGHGTLSLENLDEHSRLVVLVSREGLRLLGGDDSVTGDELGHDTANSLDALRKRGHIKEEKFRGGLAALTGQNTSLDGSSVSNSFVGIDALGWLLAAKVVLDKTLNLGNTGGSTNENNLVDLTLLDISILEDLGDGAKSLLEKIGVELLETGTGEGLREIVSLGEVLDLEASLVLGREGTLDTLDLLVELLEGALVTADDDTRLLLHHLDEVLHDTLVEILASEVGVSIGGKHLEDAIVNREESDIEGSASQIEDKDVGLSAGFVHSIGNGSSCRLVDDALDLKASNLTGILGGLTLGVIEVSRHSDDSMLDLLTKEGLSSGLHLLKNHSGNFLGGVGVAINLDVGLLILGNNVVRNKLLVGLNRLVIELTPN